MALVAEPRRDATEPSADQRPPGRARSHTLVTIAVLVGWVALVIITRRWGQHLLLELGFDKIRLGSPPFTGRDDPVIGWRTLIPVGLAGALIASLPALVQRLSWRRLLLATFLLCAIWAVALNLTRGWEGITGPMLRAEDEYFLDVPKVESPGEFLETFTADIDDYVVHVRSHPPGFLLLLWSIDAIGLAGAGWAAALCIAGGAAAAPAVLVALRDLSGERAARRAAPFLILAPAALWIASSADAFYAGVGGWSIALLAVATGRRDGRGDLLAVGAGMLFGAALMLSYGLVLLGVVVLPVLWARRRIRPAVIAVTVALAVLVGFAVAGFDYLEGFEVAKREVDQSVQSTRPFSHFAFSNLAAFSVVLGPAALVALTRLRERSTWLVVGGALAAVALADLSAMSKGEVERIWLPFAVWVVAACTAFVPDLRGSVSRELRAWLALQCCVALVVQSFVRTGW